MLHHLMVVVVEVEKEEVEEEEKGKTTKFVLVVQRPRRSIRRSWTLLSPSFPANGFKILGVPSERF